MEFAEAKAVEMFFLGTLLTAELSAHCTTTGGASHSTVIGDS